MPDIHTQTLQWSQYRHRLLEAGLGPRWVQRHVRELQDHADDLQQQAHAQGQDAAAAGSQALRQLGSLELLADNVIAHARPGVLHRHPLLMTTLLPVIIWLLSCTVLVFLLFAIAAYTQHLSPAVAAWLDPLLHAVLYLHLNILLPLFVLALVWLFIRNHCSRRYWVSGLLLLCLMGSGISMRFDLPQLAAPHSGYVAINMPYNVLRFSWAQGSRPIWPSSSSNVQRLLLNLLLAAMAARYFRTRIDEGTA